MKSAILFIAATLSFTFSAWGAQQTTAAIEYQKERVSASCKSFCKADAKTGEEFCRYSVFFSEEDFNRIKEIEQTLGLRNKWYSKAPKELCTDGTLPAFESGKTAQIEVILYKVDLSALTELL